MATKAVRLTHKERIAAERYAATGDREYAMEKAGYSYPAANAPRVFNRPAVQESIKRQQMARLNNELLPLALDVIAGIMNNPKATDSNKLTATNQVLKYTVGAAEAGDTKELHELTAEELQERLRLGEERLQRMRSEAAERARPVLEAEPSIDEAATPESGVFG